MTFFLLCMLPVAATLGFVACALLQTAASADRQKDTTRLHHETDDANKCKDCACIYCKQDCLSCKESACYDGSEADESPFVEIDLSK